MQQTRIGTLPYILYIASSHCILTMSREFYPKIWRRRVKNFSGNLELKRLDLT